ncbi:MAG: HD domain-containing protein [Lachnospiraceae bacterium]|nr:HD domain-containing protein [Lachnospiraceae bacterium]
MFELLQAYQLNIMLALSSICAVVGIFSLITKSLPRKRKLAIADMEFSAAILLYNDRLAYMFHGDISNKGYWLVRISNFLVFFMTISVLHAFNLYLSDLCRNEIGLSKPPVRLKIVEVIVGIGWALVIISQFTGIYYTFDETNAYQRGPGFLICYAIPFIALFIQLSVVIQFFTRMSLYISIPVLLFTVIPMVASIFQALYYGVSFTNMSIVGMGVVLYVFAIMEMNEKLAKAQKQELDAARSLVDSVLRSYEQTAEVFAKAIDARDKFTRGHSKRVAEYSMDIAQALGMSESQSHEVYCSALLHDIGKIEIPDTVISRHEHLSAAEEELIRKHAEAGGKILSEVNEIPFLSVAAKTHHERYDGKGYPEGIRGEAIPIIGRIVAVANAYDEMTSFKFDRPPFAQGRVRDEFVKGAGTRFDPKIADIMVDMIDRDAEYMMRESEEENIEAADRNNLAKVKRMHFDNYKELVSDGIRIEHEYIKIKFESCPDAGFDKRMAIPSIILFDSFDRCVHRNARNIKNVHYFEYAEVWLDGHYITTAARNLKIDITNKTYVNTDADKEAADWQTYEIEAVSFKDHVKLTIDSRSIHAKVTVALPDSTRYVFLGVTGEHCSIRNASVKEIGRTADKDDIERIAPEVDYFERKCGDLPNVEVDGYRETSSLGIPVEDGMRLFFHTQSLPTARLVHHCAYILLYTSDDGTVNGRNYSEFACIRLDGDDATNEGKADNTLSIRKNEDFAGWDSWKERNLKGLDYIVNFYRKRNCIFFDTENSGIAIECRSVVPADCDNVYVAITGNLCAISDIRIK